MSIHKSRTILYAAKNESCLLIQPSDSIPGLGEAYDLLTSLFVGLGF